MAAQDGTADQFPGDRTPREKDIHDMPNGVPISTHEEAASIMMVDAPLHNLIPEFY